MRNRFVIFMVVAFVLTSCSSNDYDYSNNELPIAQSGGEGFGLGLYNIDGIEGARTFHLTDGTFQRDITLSNKTSQHEQFVLLVFNGDRQMPFEVDGTRHSHFIFEVDAQEYKNIPITLEFPAGYHPVNFVLLRGPADYITDSEDIDGISRLARVMHIRTNIFYQTDNMEGIKDDLYAEAEPISEGTIHGPFIRQTSESAYAIYTSEELGPEDAEFQYDLFYGNKENEAIDSYIVVLHNWEQIPINKESETIYDRIPPGEERKVTGHIDHPEEGVLVALTLPAPFQPLPDDQPYTHAPVSSYRLFLSK